MCSVVLLHLTIYHRGVALKVVRATEAAAPLIAAAASTLLRTQLDDLLRLRDRSMMLRKCASPCSLFLSHCDESVTFDLTLTPRQWLRSD